jgi:hypothetical protein
VQALGLEPGQIVERGPSDLLFGERKAPDGTPLGRPPGSGQNAAGIYPRLLAADRSRPPSASVSCDWRRPGRRG